MMADVAPDARLLMWPEYVDARVYTMFLFLSDPLEVEVNRKLQVVLDGS